jgi:sugar phosphate isomerase/epimerase
MKLAVSNIAWTNGSVDEFARFLTELGCAGMELAPSMVWPDPTAASQEERYKLRKSLEDADLALTGIQSLMFNRPDLFLFGNEKTRAAMTDFLTDLMDLCRDLGGEILVYGSPKSRNRGNLPKEKTDKIASDFFKEISRRAEKRDVYFCIEPLSHVETDFINTVAEARHFLELLGNPEGLGLHIDIKQLIEEEEIGEPYLEECFREAKHVHISERELNRPGTTFDHSVISRRIQKSGYSRFCSIEMRRVDSDVKGMIATAVKYVQKHYF